jgi:hypothetical protein
VRYARIGNQDKTKETIMQAALGFSSQANRVTF